MSVKAVARLKDLKAIHLNKRLIRYEREDVLCCSIVEKPIKMLPQAAYPLSEKEVSCERGGCR